MPSSNQIHPVTSDADPVEALKLEQERLKRLSENPPQEIFVVSDLHLGRGRNPETRRFSRTENFLSDQAFCRWLDCIGPGADKLLFLNGDTFDFARICNHPDSQEAFEEWSQFLAHLGMEKTPCDLWSAVSKKEKTFGLQTDDYKCAWKLLQIANGHREFFTGLAAWINGGGSLLLSKGNHDLELYWPLVRRAVRALLERGGAKPEASANRFFYCDDSVRFHNVYCEHGHRLDPVQAIKGGPVLDDDPMQLNLPLGMFVNRYLVNGLEKLEPFLGAVRPIERILWRLLHTHPVAAVTVLYHSFRFLRRASKVSKVRNYFWFIIYFITVALPLVTVPIIGIALLCHGCQQWLSVTLGRYKVPLSIMGLTAPYLAAAVREMARRVSRWLRYRRRDAGEDEFATGVYEKMKGIRFPRVTCIYGVIGHTHDQDVQSLPPLNGAEVLYLNTGTWIPVWPDDRPDLAGQVLFPFVRFRREASQEYRHEYVEWRDDRGKPAESYILEPPDLAADKCCTPQNHEQTCQKRADDKAIADPPK